MFPPKDKEEFYTHLTHPSNVFISALTTPLFTMLPPTLTLAWSYFALRKIKGREKLGSLLKVAC